MSKPTPPPGYELLPLGTVPKKGMLRQTIHGWVLMEWDWCEPEFPNRIDFYVARRIEPDVTELAVSELRAEIEQFGWELRSLFKTLLSGPSLVESNAVLQPLMEGKLPDSEVMDKLVNRIRTRRAAEART